MLVCGNTITLDNVCRARQRRMRARHRQSGLREMAEYRRLIHMRYCGRRDGDAVSPRSARPIVAQGGTIVRQIPLVFGVSVAFLLLSAGITANIAGHMPEMRGAWLSHALR